MGMRRRCRSSSTMWAARLHGPADLRIEQLPHPGPPGKAQALLRVSATGICGSDLHLYTGAGAADAAVRAPLVLGHEFSAVVEEVGADSLDGCFQLLQPGARVAVDPAQPCDCCEPCERGHPNLCLHLRFCGSYPDGGSLCEWMHMPARNCFPLPETINDASAALLEPLGVAIHAVDLARIRAGDSAAILGAGPIGLLILQVARLAGADPVFISDKFPWRLQLAAGLGGIPIHCDQEDAVGRVQEETNRRGVDVAIEAAWADRSIAQAAAMARHGGRLVLAGIPSEDALTMKHSTARRKGLTILLCRRMKHAYPRAIRLVKDGKVNVSGLISHRLPLAQAAEAFALSAAYRKPVIKIIVES